MVRMNLFKIISVSLVVICLTACGSTNEEAKPEVNEEILTPEVTVVPSEEPTTSEVTSDEPMELYEAFLTNEVKVHLNMDKDLGSYTPFEKEDDGDYTLGELTDTIVSKYNSMTEEPTAKLESVEYTYIDCGMDGNKELALRISTPMQAEGWVEYLIIKAIKGKLETVYSDVAWSRSSIYFNEFGYIYGDGSGGAAVHAFDKSYVDAKGVYHFIYSDVSETFCLTEGMGYSFSIYLNGDSREINGSKEFEGEYATLTFDFNNTEESSDDISSYVQLDGEIFWGEGGYRSYFYAPIKDDDSIYDSKHPLRVCFDNAGQKVYTIKEVETMISEKEEQEGLTEEVKSGDPVEWVLLG